MLAPTHLNCSICTFLYSISVVAHLQNRCSRAKPSTSTQPSPISSKFGNQHLNPVCLSLRLRISTPVHLKRPERTEGSISTVVHPPYKQFGTNSCRKSTIADIKFHFRYTALSVQQKRAHSLQRNALALKGRTMAYDGRGNLVVKDPSDDRSVTNSFGGRPLYTE